MSKRELDEAIEKIRGEQPDENVMKAAAKRVFAGLFDSAFITAEQTTGKIRGCADVRQLIPAYIIGTLPPARRMLVEDHTLQCVDCRRALHDARHGSSARVVTMAPRRKTMLPRLALAAAAVLVVAVGLGYFGFLPGQNGVRATVASVQGTLYRVTDFGVSIVQAGAIVSNSDELRTAKGSRAILRLAGGSQVEIAERSAVSLHRDWRGETISLERGQMIAESASVRPALYVTSGDMTVPISRTIVAFDRGVKDSRVAVAKGRAAVEVGSVTRNVDAGNYMMDATLRPVSMTDTSAFDWSQNSAQYRELLNQFAGLQKDLQSIPSPELRYESKLAPYLPKDTVFYVSIPNLGGTITEAKKLFDSRLNDSDVLRQWWQQQAASKNGTFDRMIDQVSAISGYLGDEILITAGGKVSGKDAGVVFLAQIIKPGLAEYLRANLPAKSPFEIVSGGNIPNDGGKLFLDFDNNVLVGSLTAPQLQRVEEVIAQRAPADFAQTPFFARISQVYKSGAGYFLAADLEQIKAKSVTNGKALVPAGFDNVQYLVLERKQSSDDTEMRAALSFNGSRHGVASWLAAPGPAGSLDFVSPAANFATTIVMKNPRVMMQELIDFASNANPGFAKGLADFEAKAGVSVLDDIATPLGSDITFAVDGPVLPLPSWKVAIEVNDPQRLQNTIATLIDRFNQQNVPNAGHLITNSEVISSRTYYSVASDKAPTLAVYYTFVDGYLLAAWNKADLMKAISDKQAHLTLAESSTFRSKLPADGNPHFSGMLYTNFASLSDVAAQINKSSKNPALGAMLLKGGQGLICVYGEPDRISASARGSFLGFDLGTLVGIQQGKPPATIIADALPAARGGGL